MTKLVLLGILIQFKNWKTESRPLKCIRFCLQLDKMTQTSHQDFDTLNWLLVTERFNQCINSIAFKYVNDQCPNYVNEVFQTAQENNIQTWRSFLKLKSHFFQNRRRLDGVFLHCFDHMEQNPWHTSANKKTQHV